MKLNLGKLIKKGVSAGAKALLKKYGSEAEQRIIGAIQHHGDAAQEKAADAVDQVFTKFNKKAGIQEP